MLHILSGTVQQQLHIGRTTPPEMQQAKSTDVNKSRPVMQRFD